ncbi:phage portal protein [Flavobacterium agricola]|uniref:phage portal protein n=1 Tax=Flavobacterium agricola TaxID=2870839 RepID=UPI002221B29D|nr:phage portal protein [Flavobacterium agricola]
MNQIAKRVSNVKFESLDGRSNELLEKINNPNNYQTKVEFLKEFCIFLLSSGYTAIWKKYNAFGVFSSLELININPDTIGFNLNSISFTHQAIKHTVDYEQIIFFYDIRKCDTDYAISRLKPLKSQIDNIRNAQKAKGIQIDNSGTTIVSPKASTSNNIMEEGLDGPVPTKVMGPNGMIQKTQKEVMEEKLTSRGLKNRIIVSSKGMDAVNLSAQLNNVKFHEIVETDVLAFCDAFSFPPELTPYGKRATFDNKELAEIALMESEIIPISENFAKSMMSVFPKRGEVFPSFKHINAMSLIEERIQKTNGTTIDQLTVLLEKEIISKEEFRKILQTKKIIENGKSR